MRLVWSKHVRTCTHAHTTQISHEKAALETKRELLDAREFN